MNRTLRVTIEGPQGAGKTFLATLIIGMLKKTFTNPAIQLLEEVSKLDRLPAPPQGAIQIVCQQNDFEEDYEYQVRVAYHVDYTTVSYKVYESYAGPKRVIKIIRKG